MSFDSKNMANIKVSLDKAIRLWEPTQATFAVMSLPMLEVSSENGTVPVSPAAVLMGTSTIDGKFGKGDSIPQLDSDVKYIQFKCARYGGRHVVDALDKEELNARDILTASDFAVSAANHGLSTLERELGKILKAQGTAAGNDLISTFALPAGREFNNFDSATSDPMGDIQKLIEDTMNGDTLYIGRDVQNALRRHPQFTGDLGTARTAAGKMLPVSGFKELLVATFGFAHVIDEDSIYSANGVNQALSPTRALNGVCAVGHYKNIQLVVRKKMEPSVWEDKETTSTQVASYGSYDLVVAQAEFTKGLTNVLE